MTSTPVKHFENRWRLNRAGMVNVWHYYDTEFAIGGGRLILRGANGSGKSRALELLLPYLLDADRRRMDATGSSKVSLDELMRTGARGQTNRSGYLWLELARPGEYLTVGAHVKYSASAHRSEVHFFTTSLRVGHDLRLIEANQTPLSRDALADLIGPHHVTDAEGHREALRTKVFGLRGESGRDRFTGLIQLLHTLRSPDVGNRIDEGRLPQILAEALPPLGEHTLRSAGERLDNLTETRLAQERLSTTLRQVREFHKAYRAYAATVLGETAKACRKSAQAVIDTDTRVEGLRAELDRLTAQRRREEADREGLAHESGELARAIDAFRSSHWFKQADDLKHRDQAVAVQRGSAQRALATARTARDAEAGAAGRLRNRFEDVRGAVRSAAQALATAVGALTRANVVHSALPEGIHQVDTAVRAQSGTIMDTLDGKAAVVDRPAVDTVAVLPGDLAPARQAALDYADAAERRGQQADRREREARRLDNELATVRSLEAAAEATATHAQQDRDRADQAATRRDDAAIELNHGWRDWISSDTTATLLPDVSWAAHRPIALLLHDVEALTGDEADSADLLSALTALPGVVAQPVRAAHAVRHADIDREQHADDDQRVALMAERREIEADRDLPPPAPPWQTVHRGVPFWQTIDFLPDIAAERRAGLEAALLGSGLLTATVRPDGSLETADGEVVALSGRDRVARPLTQAITPDPASQIPAAIIESILRSIGLADPDAATSVDADGGWRNGAVAGRYHQSEARHIGAAARAAARRTRLAEIAARLGELEHRTRERTERRSALRRAAEALEAHLARAPGSRQLLDARATAAADADRAVRSAVAAREARQHATRQRASWRSEFDRHTAVCDGMDLPHDADELRIVTAACREAGTACRTLADRCAAVSDAVDKADTEADDLRRHTARRAEAEDSAENERAAWHSAAAELAAQHEIVDVPVAQLTAELEHTESAKRDVDQRLVTKDKSIDTLRDEISTVDKTLAAAQERAAGERVTLIEWTARFNGQAALPGLAAAVTATPLDAITDTQDPRHIDTVAATTLKTIGTRKPFTAAQLLGALARFQADTSGQLDIASDVRHDAYLIHIDGAEDRHHPAAVLDYLERRVAEGKQALTERERAVFTEFVLGGVADELRRRISQARHLITAMNDSLASVQTSYGIGVRIVWQLTKEESDLARILHLVTVADAVRSADDSDELITLLRRRVEASQAADPTAGYATHLADALDYRRWHSVEVNIVGPAPGQQRRISRRAKISQGETRFVSYVTLFAAADGYLSSLPEPDGALRLVLLDDAFAKIDERTIGDLMGLLVRFDIDFVMTGHALWGTVPQVPKLDIYEIRRIGDSAAIATRIHWDGKHRHVYAVAT